MPGSTRARPQDVTASIKSLTQKCLWQEVLTILEELPQQAVQGNLIIYSSAINACAKGQQWEAALQVLNAAFGRHFRPNAIAYGAALSACDKCGQWQWSLQLLADMAQSCEGGGMDAFCVNAAMGACGRGEMWEAALSLFQLLCLSQLQLSSLSCNTAISALEKSGQWQRALDLLGLARRKTLADVISFSAAQSACKGGRGAWVWAVALLAAMPSAQLAPNVVSLNAVISTCSGDAWPAALHLLCMDRWKLSPDVISFNTAIAALAEARWDLALGLLANMGASVRPNRRSFNAALGACRAGGHWQGALCLLQQMRGSLGCDAISCSSGIACLAAGADSWPWALQVLAEMPGMAVQRDAASLNAAIRAASSWQLALLLLANLPETDAFSYTAAIGACEAAEQWQQVLELVKDMRCVGMEVDAYARGLEISVYFKGLQWERVLLALVDTQRAQQEPDLVSYNAAVSVLQKCGEWHSALSWLSRMRREGPRPDAITFAAGIMALGRIQRWQEALEMMEDMRRHHIRPGTSTCNAALSACQASQQWEAVLQLFLGMSAMEVERDVVGYNACIGACGKGQQWEAALHVLSSMPVVRLQPTTISCNAAICACQLVSRWQAAACILSSMQDQGPLPDAATLNACMPAFGRYQKWQAALGLLFDTRTQGVDVLAYSAAMSACQNGLQWQQALLLFSDLAASSASADVRCFTAALDACAQGRQWRRAAALLARMPEARLAPDVVSFNAGLRAFQGSHQWQQALSVAAMMETSPDALTLQTLSETSCEAGQYAQALPALAQVSRIALRRLEKKNWWPQAPDAGELVLLFALAASEPGTETAYLYGNIKEYAYYFTDLLVGSPPQLTSVIIDTGSHLLAFPCGGCDHCGRHLEPAVDISKSSTAKWEYCGGDRCTYSEKYSEGSAIEGHWFTDKVELGDSFSRNSPVSARMGCHDSENKLFYTQRANGIMGLAPALPTYDQPSAERAPGILEDLFRDKKHVDSRVFSICLADWGGLLTVGGANSAYHAGGVTWVDMMSSGYYMVKPETFFVDSLLVVAGTAEFGQAIVDTGTTLTYFPQQIFDRVVMHLESFCLLPDNCQADRADRPDSHQKCWRMHDGQGPGAFPTLAFKFQGQSETITWGPEAYLNHRGEDLWCYAFAPSASGETIFGISWLLHKDAVFDLGAQKFGVADANCPEHRQAPTSLWQRFPALFGHGGAPSLGLAGLAACLVALLGLAAVRLNRWRTSASASFQAQEEFGEARQLLAA
ncbi:unnamed protein product [Effrenium voratum]|nr:unnamed protein product [Effrenium voratum]